MDKMTDTELLDYTLKAAKHSPVIQALWDRLQKKCESVYQMKQIEAECPICFGTLNIRYHNEQVGIFIPPDEEDPMGDPNPDLGDDGQPL